MSFALMAAARHPDDMSTSAAPIIAIRQATADDAATLRRIAALDSAPIPHGQVLLGIVDGAPMAAVSIESLHAVADPFHPTADLVELLRTRASRLRGVDAAQVAPRRRLRSLLPA